MAMTVRGLSQINCGTMAMARLACSEKNDGRDEPGRH